jgi:hypothetical protein
MYFHKVDFSFTEEKHFNEKTVSIFKLSTGE